MIFFSYFAVVNIRAADPDGFYPDPDPTFKKNPDLDITYFLPFLHLNFFFSFDIKVNIIDILINTVLYCKYCKNISILVGLKF